MVHMLVHLLCSKKENKKIVCGDKLLVHQVEHS